MSYTLTRPAPVTFEAYAALWNGIRLASPIFNRKRGLFNFTGLVSDEEIRAQVEAVGIEVARRDQFRTQYAFAIPTVQAVQEIVQFAAGPILEIGAGRGLWAHLIQLENGTIRPTDLHAFGKVMLSSNPYSVLQEGETWTEVQQLDAVEAAEHASEPTLLTVWPEMESWPAEALKKFTGQRVIYIGEHGGTTADEAFHDQLEKVWTLHHRISIPVWEGLYDCIHCYVRK